MTPSLHPLHVWLVRKGWTREDLAKAVGVSSALIYLVMTRRRKIGLNSALDISTLTGVPLESLTSDRNMASLRAYLKTQQQPTSSLEVANV